MAGAPSTQQLVAAAAEAGPLGVLAGGYKTAETMAAEIAAVRERTGAAFGVNLFVPGAPTADPDLLDSYVRSLAVDAEAVGTVCGQPAWDDDSFDDKVTAVISFGPPLVSFTFGCPSREVISVCQAAGSVVPVTVTSQP